MKRFSRGITSSLLFLLLFIFPSQAAASWDVFLSLIQVAGDSTDDEFVEIYNASDTPVNLSGWSLRRKSKTDSTVKGSSLKTFGTSDSIPAKGNYLWTNSHSIFKDIADTTTGSSLTNDNSLALFDKDGNILDSLTWGNGHILPYSPVTFSNPEKKERFLRDKNSFSWSLSKTALPTNSHGMSFEEKVDPPVLPLPTGSFLVRINEVFPNPDTKNDTGEFIELYNFGSNDIDLSGWSIHDATITGKYIFPSGVKIESKKYLVLSDADFTFSLNNTNEVLSLFDSASNLIHSVSYEKTKEGISLNVIGDKLKGSLRPTPGAENLLDNDPVTNEKVPKKGFKGVAVSVNARGKDSDGDKLKYVWNFGDGHKSYKEKTTHTYEKKGEYTVTLSTDDGKNTTEESFTIKITKYEYPDIRITSFMPNPEGKDTDGEWVEIENREKKEVNLKDFGIATGTKTLVNHPIRENFLISKKSKKKITRLDALIVLGNAKGKIELRAPDGHVLQHMKYKFEKSLVDNAVLQKEKGQKELALLLPVVENTPEKSVGMVAGAMTEEPSPPVETKIESSFSNQSAGIPADLVPGSQTKNESSVENSFLDRILELFNTKLNSFFSRL